MKNIIINIWLLFLNTVFLSVFTPGKTCAQSPFPDMIIENNTISSGSEFFSNCGDIISPGSEDKPFVVTGDAQVIFSSGTAIHLRPGFRASDFTGNGYFRTSMQLRVAILEPGVDVGKFEKLELGIILPPDIQKAIDRFFETDFAEGINPYDPDYINSNGISVEALFTSPTGVEHLIYGFFYRDYSTENPVSEPDWVEIPTDYHFRIRFAPDEANENVNWSCTIKVYSSQGTPFSQTCMTFKCLPSENKGYLEVGNNNYLRFSDTKESFFAIGENIAWPNEWGDGQYWSSVPDYQDQFDYLNELADNNGNYVRFVLAPWGPLVEWEHLGVYDKYQQQVDELGALIPRNRQMHLYMLDSAFEIAHERNMYIQIAGDIQEEFQAIITIRDTNGNITYCGPPQEWKYSRQMWASNPYNNPSLYNTSIPPTPKDFFSIENESAVKYYKNKLMYFFARYGYSINFAVYDILSEIDQHNTDCTHNFGNDPDYRQKILGWHLEMSDYLKDSTDNGGLDVKQLLSTTFSGTDYNHFYFIDPNIDITSIHSYHDIRPINHSRQFQIRNYRSEYNKPTFFSEIGSSNAGVDRCTDVSLHNNLWASAFMGSFGTGLHFWWQTHHPTPNVPNTGYDYLNHNPYLLNYSNLFNFIKDYDFENDIFTPCKFPTNMGNANLVEAFYLKCSNRPLIIGWVHNATYYAYNQEWSSCVPVPKFAEFTPDYDDIYSTPIYIGQQSIRILDLPADTLNVMWYNTRTGEYIQVPPVCSIIIRQIDNAGYLHTPTLDEIYPDYAFVISESSTLKSSLISQNDSSQSENNLINNSNIVVIPNPSSTGKFVIENNERFENVIFYNTMGQIINPQYNISENKISVELSSQPNLNNSQKYEKVCLSQ